VTSERVFIGFGANLHGPAGAPADTIAAAGALLHRRGVHLVRRSSLFAADPWGGVRQPVFVNGVWEVRTAHPPARLLTILLAVEKQLGRRRRVRWGPRVLDLDLLAYGHRAGRWGGVAPLQLPHPRLAQRAFVLLPLAQLAPCVRLGAGGGMNVAQAAGRLRPSARLTTRRMP